MSFNLQPLDQSQGGKGNHTPPGNPATLKLRGVRVLRAYLQAPGGLGVEAVFHCLTSLEPMPTYREAVHLTEKLPSGVGAYVLARFFAFLQAAERIQAQREREGAQRSYKPAQALVTPDRTHAPDWVPVREGGAA